MAWHSRRLAVLLLSGASIAMQACAGASAVRPEAAASARDPASVVQRQLEAYNRHDLDAFLATYSDDVLLCRVPNATPTMAGKQQVGDFYRTSRFNLPGLHADVLHRSVVGNKVIDHERVSGLRPEPVEAVAAYVVNNGLIESVWLFYPE